MKESFDIGECIDRNLLEPFEINYFEKWHELDPTIIYNSC